MKGIELTIALKTGLDLIQWKPEFSGGNPHLVRRANYATERITFMTPTLRNGHRIIGEVLGEKGIKEVEQLLEIYYLRHRLGNHLFTIYHVSKRVEWVSNHYVETESDLDQILPTIRAMVYDEILPFFERYQTVGQVYEKMERMEVKDISSFLYPPVAIRRMILKRLVNAPDFEEYGERILKNYEEGAKGPYSGTYAPFVPFLPDLFEELKTMEV